VVSHPQIGDGARPHRPILQILHGAGNHAAKKPLPEQPVCRVRAQRHVPAHAPRAVGRHRQIRFRASPENGDRPMSLIRRNLQGISNSAEKPPHDAEM
jgi:hypothetical protein